MLYMGKDKFENEVRAPAPFLPPACIMPPHLSLVCWP